MIHFRILLATGFEGFEAGTLFLEVQEVVRMTTDPLLSGGVLHGRVDPVDGDWSDAVLGVREVRADLLWFALGSSVELAAESLVDVAVAAGAAVIT